jgi:hypothetical protein
MELATIQFLCEKKGLGVQTQYMRGTGGAEETTFRPINPAVCAERSASDNLTAEVPSLECIKESLFSLPVYFPSLSLH